MDEIERKFLVKQLPDLSKVKSLSYERFYLYVDNGIELRVQRKGDEYELERKVASGNLSRTSNVFAISIEEFNILKKLGGKAILRDCYQLSENPNISIKIYHHDYEGLIRAEFEFDSEKEALSFTPPDWCGTEITNSDLGRDSRLITLTKEDFKNKLLSF